MRTIAACDVKPGDKVVYHNMPVEIERVIGDIANRGHVVLAGTVWGLSYQFELSGEFEVVIVDE
jgi:hypothetical protein